MEIELDRGCAEGNDWSPNGRHCLVLPRSGRDERGIRPIAPALALPAQP